VRERERERERGRERETERVGKWKMEWLLAGDEEDAKLEQKSSLVFLVFLDGFIRFVTVHVFGIGY